MPSKTGKAPASYYKSDVSVNQTTNVGFDSTTRLLISGDGASSAASLSDDVLSVQPINDDTTATMIVKNQGGSNILAVDTTNSKVLCGSSQVPALTLNQSFCLSDANASVAGTHYLLPIPITDATGASRYVPPAFGTGTNPLTSLTHSADPWAYLPAYWYLQNNITLDEVRILARAEGDTTMNFHVMSFDVTTGSGSTAGDLSNGIYNAASGTTDPDSLSPITVENDRITITTLTIENADINSGKVVFATYENVGTTDDISVQLIIKYHIR